MLKIVINHSRENCNMVISCSMQFEVTYYTIRIVVSGSDSWAKRICRKWAVGVGVWMVDSGSIPPTSQEHAPNKCDLYDWCVHWCKEPPSTDCIKCLVRALCMECVMNFISLSFCQFTYSPNTRFAFKMGCTFIDTLFKFPHK